jgi:hypothetical protein
MRLSFVIPTYNAKKVLLDCINSIKRTVKIQCEVIVVDNGSTDSTSEELKKNFPDITVIKLPWNYGFARAVNLGIKTAKGEYICILNNDTLLTEGATDTIIDFMQNSKNCGIAGPQLLNQNGTKQNSIAPFPTFLTEFGLKSALKALFPEKFYSKHINFAKPVEVDSLVGAVIVVKREVFDRIGLFDENYFLFLEETDFCYQAKKHGILTFFVPQAKVYHLQGYTKQSMLYRASVEYLNSMGLFFKKNYGFTLFLIFRILSLFKIAINMLFQFAACLATLFVNPPSKRNLLVNCHLFLWHICLCPKSMLLSRPIPKYIHISKKTRFWKIKSDAVDVIEKISLSDAEIIKEVRIKRLLRWQDFFVKVYKHTKFMDFVRSWFGVCKSFSELKRYLEISSRGIDTITVTAACLCKGEDFLIFEELRGWQPLDEFLKECHQVRLKNTILYKYGEFARKIHDACVFQYDFDPNNIMVNPDNMSFKLIDCERVSFPAVISLKKRLKCLAKSNRFEDATFTDRIRFLRGYFKKDSVKREEFKGIIKKLNELWQGVLRRASRRMKKNCVSENRNFGRFRFGEYLGYYRKVDKKRQREGVLPEEILEFIRNNFDMPEFYKIECDDVIKMWIQKNAEAVHGSPPPFFAIVLDVKKGYLVFKR